MAALCWMFIGSAVLCYAYAAYVILCAIALTVKFFVWNSPRTDYEYRSMFMLYFIKDHLNLSSISEL